MFILSSIALYALYFMVRNRKGKLVPWFAPPAVLLLASCSFALSDIGKWAGGVLGDVLGWPASWFGAPAAAAVVITMVLLLIGLVLDIAVDRKADRIAKVALILIPLLALATPSPVSDAISKVVHPVGNVGPSVTKKLSGQ